MNRPCVICGEEVTGRKDKTTCSPECKQERKRRYDRERYPEIREETIRRACDYQRANPGWKQQYDREYRKNRDKEKHAAWSRAFLKANPEYSRMAASKRRSRMLNNGTFNVSIKDLQKLRHAYGDACAYCGGAFTGDNPLEWDHVVPISRGGSHGIGNLAPSCFRCNRSKSNRLVIEWRHNRFTPRKRDLGSLTIIQANENVIDGMSEAA